MQVCQELAQDQRRLVIVRHRLQGAVAVESLEQHDATIGVRVEESNHRARIPRSQADHGSCPLWRGRLQFQSHRSAVAAADGDHDARLARPRWAVPAQPPPPHRAVRSLVQHARPRAVGVVM